MYSNVGGESASLGHAAGRVIGDCINGGGGRKAVDLRLRNCWDQKQPAAEWQIYHQQQYPILTPIQVRWDMVGSCFLSLL